MSLWDPITREVRSSYVEPIVDPGTAPADDPVICLRINAAWIPVIIGCLMQAMQPLAWTADSAALPDLLGRVTDLISIVGTSGECIAMEFRLTAECGLQYSTDGGTTWIDVTDWSTNFPLCVRSNQARVVMQAGYDHPPVPEWTVDGTDWVYSPSP
jgi:hypothetical protein